MNTTLGDEKIQFRTGILININYGIYEDTYTNQLKKKNDHSVFILKTLQDSTNKMYAYENEFIANLMIDSSCYPRVILNLY